MTTEKEIYPVQVGSWSAAAAYMKISQVPISFVSSLLASSIIVACLRFLTSLHFLQKVDVRSTLCY